jgi:hypothetical protein
VVTQRDIARRCGIDISSVNKILHQKAGATFSEQTVRAVLGAARDLGFDIPGMKHSHQRRHPRRKVDLEIELVIKMEKGPFFNRGIARLIDLSLGGALIGELALPERYFPLDRHSIALRFREGPLADLVLPGRLVRFSHQPEGLAIGIDFPFLDDMRKRELGKFLETLPAPAGGALRTGTPGGTGGP